MFSESIKYSRRGYGNNGKLVLMYDKTYSQDSVKNTKSTYSKT